MRTILGKQIAAALPLEERSRLQYVAVDGTIITLTDQDNGTIVMPGMLGFADIAYDVLTKELPAADGAALLGIRRKSRDLFIPLFIEESTRVQLLAKRRKLVNAFDPTDGDGDLQMLQPDGSMRHLPVRYLSGMEGDQGAEAAGLHWETYGLSFKALSPAWLDRTDVYFRWVIDATAPFFPLLPVTLVASQIIGNDVPVTNIGDERGYPRWKVTGRCTAVTLTNNTTGETFTVTHSQTGPSNFMMIDTRPGIKTVVDENGTNLWPSLSSDPKLWALVRGDNSVALEMSGTDATSFIEMWYTPRYKTSA